jgi:hypothetical protein
MKNIQNKKVFVSFDEGILFVKFQEKAEVDLADAKTIFQFARERSHGRPFCVLFDPSGSMFNTTDEALKYVVDNPDNHPIIAKAYIVRNKIMAAAAKFHLLFDSPKIKPHFFESEEAAKTFLRNELKDIDLHHDFTDDKVHLEFTDRIFYIRYNKGVTVDETDLREIYDWARQRSKGQAFGVVLDKAHDFIPSEDAVDFITHNIHNQQVVGKAYVSTDPTFKTSVRLHNAFDDPDIKLKLFETKEEALVWIRSLLTKN